MNEPHWPEKYDLRVPVIEFDGAVISDYPLDRGAVVPMLGRNA